jgi:hypothetical protein
MNRRLAILMVLVAMAAIWPAFWPTDEGARPGPELPARQEAVTIAAADSTSGSRLSLLEADSSAPAEPKLTIRVWVLQTDTKLPALHSRVAIVSAPSGLGSLSPATLAQAHWLEVDATGQVRFDFETPPSLSLLVVVESLQMKYFEPVELEPGQRSAEVEIQVPGAGAIFGTVTVNGFPLDACRVKLIAQNFLNGTDDVVTGPSGTFEFAAIPAGIWHLRFSAENLPISLTEFRPLQAGQRQDRSWEISSDCQLIVELEHPSGSKIPPELEVSVHTDDGRQYLYTKHEDGTAKFRGFQAGPVRVSFGWPPAARGLDRNVVFPSKSIELQPGLNTLRILGLARDITLQGFVRIGGQMVRKGWISTTLPDGEGVTGPIIDGAYRLKGLCNSELRFQFQFKGAEIARRELFRPNGYGEISKDFSLSGGRLKLRVLHADGQTPVAYCPVQIKTTAGIDLAGLPGMLQHTDSKGELQLEATPLEDLWVTLGPGLEVNAAPSDLETLTQKIPLAALASGETTVVQMRKTGRLQLEVLDGMARPIAGASAYTYDLAGNEIVGLAYVSTDQSGQLALVGCPAEQFYLLICHPNYAPTLQQVAAIDPKQSGSLTIKLETGLPVDFVTAGEFPRGAKLYIQSQDFRLNLRPVLAQELQPGSTTFGFFNGQETHHLHPGHYTATLIGPNGPISKQNFHLPANSTGTQITLHPFP